MNAQDIATIASSSGDPVFAGLAWVLGIVMVLYAVSKPLIGIVKDFRSNSVDSAKADAAEARSNAEVILYQQLQSQLTLLSDSVEKIRTEKMVWYQKSVELESEVARLQNFEKMVDSMKIRLDNKDGLIAARDAELRQQNRLILELNDRIHKLEMRVTKDEQQLAQCKVCAFKERT
jgi:DNA repair exonuclease SbcCD ATPase subunit